MRAPKDSKFNLSAKSDALSPLLFLLQAKSPLESKRSTTSSLPFCTARCSGVFPTLFCVKKIKKIDKYFFFFVQ